MINMSKTGYSLQDCRLSQRYCFNIHVFNIHVFSVVTLCQNFERICHGAKEFYIPSVDSARKYSTDIRVDGRKVFKIDLTGLGPGLNPMANFLQGLFKPVFA
jgi:hypothetical protein